MKVKKTAIAMGLLAMTFCMATTASYAQDDLGAQVTQIRQQLEDLQKKLDDLQKAQSEKTMSNEEAENLKSALQRVKDTVEEPEGSVQTAISDVAKLKKIKVSGYIQSRYESYQTPLGVANTANNSAPDNRVYMRRGRFKITGQPTSNTLGVVQLDISGYDRSKVESKDLYIEHHPWGIGVPAPFYVRMGQQNWPFGYVIERSSSAREVPERPKAFAGTTVGLPTTPSFSGLFPGERDKGITLLSTEGSKLDWALGLFNGTGTKSGDPGKAFLETGGKFEDNNTGKAIVGRLRGSLSSNLNVGGSIFSGNQAVRTVSDATSSTNVAQTRWGTDFQYYMNGASIKGEYIAAQEPYYSNTKTTASTTSGTNRSVTGWYLVGVKNLGDKYQAVAQYDVMNDKAMAKTFGKLSTWNLGVVRFLDDATRVKLFYEINNEQINPVKNDGLRVELITVF